MRATVESIRKDGVVDEEVYPFAHTKDEYYQKIPDYVETKAYKIPFNWEWAHTSPEWRRNPQEVLMDNLRYGPLVVSIYSGQRPKKGIYQRTEKTQNHVVTLLEYVEGEYWLIWDHYKIEFKKLAWDFNFGAVILPTLHGEIDIVKKYKGQLIKNPESPKVYYSNGEQLAWIKDIKSFRFGTKAQFWGSDGDITEILTPLKEDIKF